MFLTDFWKKLRIYLWSLGIFISLWVLASWLPIFVTAEPSQTISIDRSEPRFESHTGSKIRKTLKNDGNFDVSCKFLAKSHSKLFHPDQENKRQDIWLSIEKKLYILPLNVNRWC